MNCARNLLLEYLDAKNTSGVEPGSCNMRKKKRAKAVPAASTKRAKALIINGVGKALESVTNEIRANDALYPTWVSAQRRLVDHYDNAASLVGCLVNVVGLRKTHNLD